MKICSKLILWSGVCAIAGWASAQSSDTALDERNWFDDPYFQVRNAIPNCPQPRGPYTTEKEKKAEAHWRVERGTSCWLEGKCSRQNSYLYDKDIATAVKDAFERSSDYAHSSLWITVTRRFIIVQGCGPDSETSSLETFLAPTPDVERVIVEAGSDPSHVPYRLLRKTPNSK